MCTLSAAVHPTTRRKPVTHPSPRTMKRNKTNEMKDARGEEKMGHLPTGNPPKIIEMRTV